MGRREIIKIDEEKCTGCGLCIPNCPEGALQVIDGKARLISDIFCDGLGACIGFCPEGAISIEKRETRPYDEKKVMENITEKGENTIKAHLKHLKDHGEMKYYHQASKFLKEKGIENPLDCEIKDNNLGCDDLPCGCPGTQLRAVNTDSDASKNKEQASALRQWPVQLNLLPVQAPFFENSHLLVASDCVPFASHNFHSELLRGRSVVIGCPKLDDVKYYKEKLTEILKQNNIKSITVAIMEVPCCNGMYSAAKEAIDDSGKKIPIIKKVIGVSGTIN